jgi:hypothetical protein
MKITTRIATIIVAADPVMLPVTNAIESIALGIAEFNLEIAMETARLREEKNRSALERARMAAREAGVPVAVVEKAERSERPLHEMQAETARWRNFSKTMTDIRNNNTVIDDTTPFDFREL